MILLALLLGLQTQADLNETAERADQAADAAMNAQYGRTMAAMRRADALPSDRLPGLHRTGPSRANALLQAQRAWLGFRNAQCNAEGAAFAGGSAHGAAVSGCLATLTRERTRQLAAMAQR